MSNRAPFGRGPRQARSAEPIGAELSFGSGRLRALRAAVADRARRAAVPGRQVERLLIIVSELATNAIRHGGGGGRLRLWRDADTVYCQVSDAGPGIADPAAGSEPPDPTSTAGGRGLWICRHLAGDMTIESGPGGRGAVVTAAVPDQPVGAGVR